ncbi:zinc finger, FYVE domain containing protein [Diplocarpon rosae]|nr:zinc finger, FYVE domain containing protein [Diplocarpon rosae]
MNDPPSYDQHLLDRLNALRKSSVDLEASKSKPFSPKPSTPVSDLSARLKSLRNGTLSSSSSPALESQPQQRQTSQRASETLFPATIAEDPDPLREPFSTDDKTLEELLAELGPGAQWTLNPDDPSDVQKLLNEAKSALARDGPEAKAKPECADSDNASEIKQNKPASDYLARGLDMSSFSLDDGKDGEGDEEPEGKERDLEEGSREAQDIVARILDEVNLERGNESNPDEGKEMPAKSENEEKEEGSGLSLPSTPSTLPEPAGKKSLDFEADIAARMAALKGLSTNVLGLPSAPTSRPIDKPVKGGMKNFTDEEVDNWCIICQDDATVNCLGCDGDLYCANCWKEGHMGPDVGWEEKRHKWVRFRKPN